MKKGKILVSLLLACIMALGGAVMVSAAEVETTDASVGNKLKITADNANVDVQLSGNGQYSYDYDSSKFTVTTTKNGSTFEITVSANLGAVIGFEDRVTVYIPDQTYEIITGVCEKGGLHLPAVNANITITNNAGAASVRLPSDYNKMVNYTGVSGSGSLAMGKCTDFAINAKFSACAISIPSNWPAYSNGNSSYSYTSGSGMAKINIDLTKCSFTFGE